MSSVSYDKEFVFQNGQRAKNLAELVSIIAKLSDTEFSQFVNPYKNDFANWFNDVIMDYDLAAKLRKTFSKDETVYIINTRLSSIIADSKSESNEISASKPLENTRKLPGIMGGLFKKKEEHKKEEHSINEFKKTLSEPEKKSEYKIQDKLREHETISHNIFTHKESNQLKHPNTGEESSENVLWMLLYGLVIGLILILIMYRFVF